jgi:hypothetical protein
MATKFEAKNFDLRLLAYAWRYHCVTAPGLAIGSSSAAAVLIANTTVFINAGVFKSKSTAEKALAGTALAVSQKCKWLVCLAADGTPSVTQSAIVAAADDDPDLPEIPAGETPIGYVMAETDSSHTFTPGTTLLSASGITDTYVDLVFNDSGNHGIDITAIPV